MMAMLVVVPPSNASSALDPVLIVIISLLLAWNSVAVVNPIGTSLDARLIQGIRDWYSVHMSRR